MKEMKGKKIETDIDRLIKGSIDDTEFDALVERIAKDGSDPDFQNSFKDLWNETVEPEVVRTKIKHHNFNRTLLSIAASIAIIVTIAGAFSFPWTSNKEHFLSVNTPSRKIESLDLSDGSHIQIGSLTTFQYIGNYDDVEQRNVKLNGEAYFHIAKNPAKPFIIRTGLGTIKVLGTSFNVRSFSDENLMEVTVLTGKVSVTVGKSDWILIPDQQLLVNTETGKSHIKNVEAIKSIEWTKNRIFFNEASLPEVINRFEKFYGIEIDYKGFDYKRVSISGEYDSLNVEDNIRMICFSANLKYKKQNNNYKIYE